MSVSKKEVLATATLARLRIDEKEVDHIASQMEDIVGYMDILAQVDTNDVCPLYSPMQGIAAPREDVAFNKRSAEENLANAPEKHNTFFVVPPVL